MNYLLIWIVGIAIGFLFFRDYLLLYLLIVPILLFINRKYRGTFTKYLMTTFIPPILSQLLTVMLSPQLSQIYQAFLVPSLTRMGISVPKDASEHFLSIAVVLPILILEPFFLWWARMPIRRNHNAFMRDFLQKDAFRTFTNHLSNMLQELDQETHWNDKDYIHLDAEVDVAYDNKIFPKTKNLLRALQQSPWRNDISLVIGDPGSGKSVAMRKLCGDLLKRCWMTKRIPLYVNLKHWNQNWEDGQELKQEHLEKFIQDSLKSYGAGLFTQFLNNHFYNILENRGWFFILDSYDEIPFLVDKTQDTQFNSHVSKIIYDFLALNQCGGVLSSRPFRSPDGTAFRAGNRFRISPFNDRQIIGFFKKDLQFSRSKCRGLFADHPDIVDLARTPLLASLIRQYYDSKEIKGDWPSNQRQLYEELMCVRIRESLQSGKYSELTGVSLDRILEMTASMAYLMMENERYHGFITLSEAHSLLPYRCQQINAAAKLLENAKICKLGGSNQEVLTFVHRRFMEFFVTQSSQFKKDPVQTHLSDIWTLGNYHDVFVLYGELCGSDDAHILAQECCHMIMDPANDFSDIQKDACLYGVNSLSFLFHAFRSCRDLIKDYMEEISEKVADALEQGCHDIACIAVFATAMPIFSPRYQENILVHLLQFQYKWISQYLGRIFYQGKIGLENLLLAYIENLNIYSDAAFLKELPIFLFVFAKEKRLLWYCWLRVVDILLSAVLFTAVTVSLIWIYFFSDWLAFTLRDPSTWLAWFQALPPTDMLIFVLAAVCGTVFGISLIQTVNFFRGAAFCGLSLMMGLNPAIPINISFGIILLLSPFPLWDPRLSHLVVVNLRYQVTSGKLKKFFSYLFFQTVLSILVLLPTVLVWSSTQIADGKYAKIVYPVFWATWLILLLHPARWILDSFRLRAALKQMKQLRRQGDSLERIRLEEMLQPLRGKYHRKKLIHRLYAMNFLLTGEWTNLPIIGDEKADWMLAELNRKDRNVIY